MDLKFSIITGFLGQLKDRFKFYQEPRDLDKKLELASRIEGAEGVELIYPYDFQDVDETQKLLEKWNLKAAAVNVDIKGESVWNHRSLTADDEGVRKKAVEYIAEGAEISRKLGANLVSVCPLQDGVDYFFEADYGKMWKYFIDGLRDVASSYPDVKISLEYKMSEPLAHYLLGTVGKALYTCLKVGLDNVGVTLDTGHSLLAYEIPAESLTLLAEEGRLFHVHINDNNGTWDWDLISGSVNPIAYLEFLYYLKKYGYDGWLSLDVTPRHRDPVEVFRTSIDVSKKLAKLVDEIDESVVEEAFRRDEPSHFLNYLYSKILG